MHCLAHLEQHKKKLPRRTDFVFVNRIFFCVRVGLNHLLKKNVGGGKSFRRRGWKAVIWPQRKKNGKTRAQLGWQGDEKRTTGEQKKSRYTQTEHTLPDILCSYCFGSKLNNSGEESELEQTYTRYRTFKAVQFI